jgi:ribosome-binding protein aMBF1 (putative translation factor)
LCGAVSWQSLGLAGELQDLHLESATSAPGAKAIEIATASGRLFHIGSASVRAVIDQKFAQRLAHESDAATHSLGERLRKARERSGVTQQELESRSGLAQALISKLERGKHQPRFDTLQRYADGLGVSVTSLLR